MITTHNLLDHIDEIGPWSAYGLASEALQHYFPDEYDEHGHCEVSREAELVDKLGCRYWQDVVKKYHTEIGYTRPGGIFDDGAVNKF